MRPRPSVPSLHTFAPLPPRLLTLGTNGEQKRPEFGGDSQIRLCSPPHVVARCTPPTTPVIERTPSRQTVRRGVHTCCDCVDFGRLAPFVTRALARPRKTFFACLQLALGAPRSQPAALAKKAVDRTGMGQHARSVERRQHHAQIAHRGREQHPVGDEQVLSCSGAYQMRMRSFWASELVSSEVV